jgi:ABC-type transport system involved in multi-copper enzyme maturation permease subunit
MTAALMRAETRRFWSRRMTWFFPGGLAGLMVIGVGIAAAVIIANESDPQFAGSQSSMIGEAGSNVGDILGPLLPVMAWVIGASFIGADAKTGMLEQLLTWEPRRMRFLATRAVVAAVSVAVLAIALSTLLVVLLYGLAAATGTVDGTSSEVWGDIAMLVLRSGAASGLFAVLGLGVTALINSSTGSIVGFMIYWLIIEGTLVMLFLPRIAAYLPVINASSFATGSPVERLAGSVLSGESDFVEDHTYLVAGAVLLMWSLVAFAVGALAFHRRDID